MKYGAMLLDNMSDGTDIQRADSVANSGMERSSFSAGISMQSKIGAAFMQRLRKASVAQPTITEAEENDEL